MPAYVREIIDPHTHLWDLSMGKHPWLRAHDGATAVSGLEQLRRNFLVEDYLQVSKVHNVVATVHIEALWEPADRYGEIAWLDSLDKKHNIATRYVAAAPFGDQAADEIIQRHLEHPRVVGFRAVISHHPTQPAKSWAKSGDVAYDAAWRRDIATLARAGASLDLMMYPYQVDEVIDLARQMPDLCIVINHNASPIDRDEEGMERWRSAVRKLAQAPNILIKVNMVGYDPNPSYQSTRDMSLHCIDCFGSTRVMFGTDWPVSTRYTAYETIFDNFKRITADFAPGEQRALFHDNAKRTYRL